MPAWIFHGKAILGEHALALLCSECPCQLEFEVCGARDCGCLTGGIPMGKLSGRYRVTYLSGAIRTRSDYKWNFAAPGYCYGACEQPCFCVFLGGNRCPGFTESGFDTAEEAEAYGKGKSEVMEFDGTREIYLRFSDDLCSDSIGCINYRIVRELASTEAERMIRSLPEEFQ